MVYLFAVAVIASIIFVSYVVSLPPDEEEEETEDPTQSCWHDDDFYSDTQI